MAEKVSSQDALKKLELVEEALKKFDRRGKQIHEQRASREAEIHNEIDQLHGLLDQRESDQRRAVLLGELEELTQYKVKELVAQRDQVEMTQAQLSSCLEYTEDALETGAVEFNPDSLQPETEADIKLFCDDKQELEKAIGEVFQLEGNESFSSANSRLDPDGLKGAPSGQQKTALFVARNKKNLPFKHNLRIKAELSDRNNKSKTECEVAVQEAGQYEISYTPMRRGDRLHIAVKNKPIPGSPFKIAVTGVQVTAECFQQPTRVIRGLEYPRGLDYPRGVAVNSKGHLIVIDSSGFSITTLTQEGVEVCSFGSDSSGDARISCACGVTVDKDDNIYSSSDNNYIQKFSVEGQLISKVGTYGYCELQFNLLKGITYNRNDNLLYCADNGNHRIQVLTTDLTFVRAFGKFGSGNGELTNPFDLAVDSANNLYVAEFMDNQRVQVFTTTGQFLRSFSKKTTGVLSSPWAIAVDSSAVYVSEANGPESCVSVFSSQGDFITSFHSGIECMGLAVDKNRDTLIVSDHENCCLYLY